MDNNLQINQNRFIKRVEKMTEQHTGKICWTIFQLN